MTTQAELYFTKLLWNHPPILFQNLFYRTASHDMVRKKWSVCH